MYRWFVVVVCTPSNLIRRSRPDKSTLPYKQRANKMNHTHESMMTLNKYYRFGRRKCSKNHGFVQFWKCSLRSRSMMLESTDSRKPTLISREISFKEFQPMWSQITNVTDRQTDRRHAIAIPRICTKVHCAVINLNNSNNSNKAAKNNNQLQPENSPWPINK